MSASQTVEQLKAFVQQAIINVNQFVNVEGMNSEQIRLTASLVIQEFVNLNIADIKLCFQMGMAGRFGKLYNRIDGQIILGWLREYQEHRFEVAECIELQKGATAKNQQPITIADAKKMYEDYKARQPMEAEQDAEQRDKDQHQKLFQARLELAQAEIDKIPAPNFNGMSKEEAEKAQAEHKNQRFEILKKYGVI